MNQRVLFIVVGAVACLATLTCVLVQGRQLASLRTEQQRLVSKSRLAEDASPQSSIAAPTSGTSELRIAASPAFELLRLRSQVNRLRTRREELLAITNESVQLRAQLRDRATNAPTATALPPGYILRSKAQFAGFKTPEDSMQSFLWAVQNRDLNSLLQTLTPESARQLASAWQLSEAKVQRGGSSTNEVFKRLEPFVGMAILDRQQLPDGDMRATVEVLPGLPPLPLRFRLIEGQWKIEFPR